VTVGNGGATVAVGWSTGAKTTSWRHSLAAEGDEIEGYTKNTIGDGRFVTAYENDHGKGRVIARSLENGEIAWQTTLSEDDRDPYPVEMGMTRGRVMIVTRDGMLHVLDAANGAGLHHM
jgi:outer membrane protein assembly factor BamB